MNRQIEHKSYHPKVTVLSGGVGGARFLCGLAKSLPAGNITAIVNTGDDLELGGLYISPDVDIVTCTLAGIINEHTGWGIADDTFACQAFLKKLGVPIWFNLGDRDLAFHLYRTTRLKAGATLTQIAKEIASKLHVGVNILPMSNERVTSILRTEQGEMTFEEYLVKHRCAHKIQAIHHQGADVAAPTQQALDAIRSAELIFFAPSNPFVSIGAILALPGIKEALYASAAPITAISPIISGNAVKGPAAKMLSELGHEPSASGVARLYKGLAHGFVLDARDSDLAPRIEMMGYRVFTADSLIANPAKRPAFAHRVLAFARTLTRTQC